MVAPCKQRDYTIAGLEEKSCLSEQFHHLAYPFKFKLKNDVCHCLLIYNIFLKMSLWLLGVGHTSEHSLCGEHLGCCSEQNQLHDLSLRTLWTLKTFWKWCHDFVLQHWLENDGSYRAEIIQETVSLCSLWSFLIQRETISTSKLCIKHSCPMW